MNGGYKTLVKHFDHQSEFKRAEDQLSDGVHEVEKEIVEWSQLMFRLII